MKKNMIIIIASIVVVISIAASYYFSSNINESDISEKIVITKYKYTYIEDKKIVIDSKKEKKFISEKINQIKSEKVEGIALLIANDVEISYGDNISIIMQLDRDDYCMYSNNEDGSSYLAKIPKDLHEFVTKKLK